MKKERYVIFSPEQNGYWSWNNGCFLEVMYATEFLSYESAALGIDDIIKIRSNVDYFQIQKIYMRD